MQQNLILLKTFGDVKKARNEYDGENTDRLKNADRVINCPELYDSNLKDRESRRQTKILETKLNSSKKNAQI